MATPHFYITLSPFSGLSPVLAKNLAFPQWLNPLKVLLPFSFNEGVPTTYTFSCPISSACHGTWKLYLYSMVNGTYLSKCAALISVHLVFFVFRLLPSIVVPVVSPLKSFVDLLIKKLYLSFISVWKCRKPSWHIGYSIYGFDFLAPSINIIHW